MQHRPVSTEIEAEPTIAQRDTWDATPRAAMTRIAARWPDLRFVLQALPAE